MDRDEFVEWLEYGSRVVPYFEHQIMREFKINKSTLDSWAHGKCSNHIMESVVEWMISCGFKKI